MTKETPSINLGFGSWLLCQIILFIVHFGFDKKLPLWVLWFPTIIVLAIVLGFVLLFIILGIGVLIFD